MSSSGSISAGDDFTNDWSSTFTNTGNITTTDDFTNKGSMTNSGTVTAGDYFKNQGSITNSNTINVGGDFYNDWSTTINNTGDITVTYDMNNNGTIHNDGSLIVDGSYSGSGDVDGTGTLCNSDGSTDPTGGSKNVSCPICGTDATSLPVELVQFSANANGNVVTLHWITASEINNNYFEVLKSADNQHFESVGKVNGAGNSNVMRNYSFEDDEPEKGVIYYKLTQVDFDGKTTLSKTVMVETSGKTTSLKVYPNPVSSGEEIILETGEGMKRVEIYDISGSLVKSLESNDKRIEINSSGLAEGVYFIKLTLNQTVITKRIVIR